jgi:peptidoglycan/xylan/chitin deacetylase (PgdA/CDA1 family)
MTAQEMRDWYERDYVGLAGKSSELEWPNGAGVAVNFVINYEEGAENSVQSGDRGPEQYLRETPSSGEKAGLRDLNVESTYDYGARVGVWRLLELFEEFELPATVFAVGRALELNPAVGQAFASSRHEVASHHYRWIDYAEVDEETERQHLDRSVTAIEEATGQRPVGFYGGRVSTQTRRLVLEEGGFLYDSDLYDDDVPRWFTHEDKRLLLIPYSLDTNDLKFLTAPGFAIASQFADYLCDSLDQLQREAVRGARMMSVGLHCRITGRPGRVSALRRFVEHVKQQDASLWVCTRVQLAEHCYATQQ